MSMMTLSGRSRAAAASAATFAGLSTAHHEIRRCGVERNQPFDRRRGHDRRRDQDRLDAAGRQHLGFAELGAAQADRAGIQLQARDRQALVRLGVRPQRDARAASRARPSCCMLRSSASRSSTSTGVFSSRRDPGLPIRCACKRMSSSMSLTAIQTPIPKSSARCALANFAAGSTCARTLQKRSAIG